MTPGRLLEGEGSPERECDGTHPWGRLLFTGSTSPGRLKLLRDAQNDVWTKEHLWRGLPGGGGFWGGSGERVYNRETFYGQKCPRAVFPKLLTYVYPFYNYRVCHLTPHKTVLTHENVELDAAKHGTVHIPTKLRCNAYPHQTLPVPLGVRVPHFGKHCAVEYSVGI